MYIVISMFVLFKMIYIYLFDNQENKYIVLFVNINQ